MIYRISVIILLVLMISCSPGNRTVKISSVFPSQISISSEVKSLVLLDRTKLENQTIDIVEGVLTGETPQQDKAAVDVLLSNIKSQLDFSPRFTTKVAQERFNGNSLTAVFPSQMSWSQIEDLCATYNVDAVLAVEVFDTDFIITDGKRNSQKKVKDANGIEKTVVVDEYFAEGVNTIKTGIRVYIPKTREIADQHYFSNNEKWSAVATSKADALSQLINRNQANANVARVLGKSYGNRIAPQNVIVTRAFRGKYKKCPALEQGSRYADMSKWNEAIAVWKSGLNVSESKSSGFLTYSIAVAYEVLGEYENAKEWASKSYIQYGNDEAKKYLDQLTRRIRNEEITKQQIGD